MSLPLILRLDIAGKPVKWIPWQEAACLYARDMVAWTAGDHDFELHGGHSRLTGLQTIVEVNSVFLPVGFAFRIFELEHGIDIIP